MTGCAFAVQAERLAKRFGRFEAVRGASFRIREGRITALLGENGSGKTTILRMMMGFLRPDAGGVSLHAERAGYIPERPAFFPWLKGAEIVRATARKYGLPPATAGTRVEELCGLLGIDRGLLGRRADTYSAGTRKKFSCLQSLLVGPDLVIADEPFSSLDPPSISVVREVFEGLRAEGKTVFLSSHHLAETERICDDFIVIRRGKIIAGDNLPRLRDGHVFLRFERSLQMTGRSIPPAFPWQISGRFVDWLVPRERLGAIDRALLDKAEVLVPDLERLYLFLAE